MIKRITVSLPHDLLAGAKRKAVAGNRTLTSVIEEGVRLVLAEGRKRRHYPLRLSTATGPPLPGIDISNSAALQEMEDLEYVERLRRGFK